MPNGDYMDPGPVPELEDRIRELATEIATLKLYITDLEALVEDRKDAWTEVHSLQKFTQTMFDDLRAMYDILERCIERYGFEPNV